MKDKIAATALVLLLLTFGAEANGGSRRPCSDLACILACIVTGHTGGYCNVAWRHCVCNKGRRRDGGSARLGRGKAPLPHQDGFGEGELAAFMERARRAGEHA
ncbi:unnamed protein product [Urochloa decumbens]|uniref:Invertebrate defensins family profile domain-containing protein n=1 Tax=Urochloa decumbens TaxID=240449 RepID=A0ABC9CP70_9POAL